MKVHSDLRPLVDVARETEGWAVEPTTRHIRFVPPEGPMIVCSSTPGDRREKLNLRARLRRAGLLV